MASRARVARCLPELVDGARFFNAAYRRLRVAGDRAGSAHPQKLLVRRWLARPLYWSPRVMFQVVTKPLSASLDRRRRPWRCDKTSEETGRSRGSMLNTT